MAKERENINGMAKEPVANCDQLPEVINIQMCIRDSSIDVWNSAVYDNDSRYVQCEQAGMPFSEGFRLVYYMEMCIRDRSIKTLYWAALTFVPSIIKNTQWKKWN